VGALASAAASEGLLAAALLLAPSRGAHSRWSLQLTLRSPAPPAPALRSAAARELARNAMADALPVCEALAGAAAADLALPLSSATGLQLTLTPLA
jgi:hypothetical protein